MILGAKRSLDEVLVEILTRSPGSSAKRLHEIISFRHEQISVQALYQRLSLLEHGGIVVKTRGRYSLRLTWITQLSDLMDTAYEAHVASASLDDLLPASEQKVSFKLSGLSKVVALYSQLVLTACQSSTDKAIYDWCPHVWYHLANRQDETQVLKSMKLMGIKYYLVVEGDTVLDLAYKDFFAAVEGEVAFGVSDFVTVSKNNYCVAGDYIFTVRLGKELSARLKAHYEDQQSNEHTLIRNILTTMNRRSPAWLRVEHSPQKAERIRKHFRRFFGVVG